MKKALYGRMRMGRCLRKNYGYLGCFADVLSLMNSHCSGKQTCQISVTDAIFGDIDHCPLELENYLEVSYACVKGTACVIF